LAADRARYGSGVAAKDDPTYGVGGGGGDFDIGGGRGRSSGDAESEAEGDFAFKSGGLAKQMKRSGLASKK